MGIDTAKLGAMHERMQWYVDQEILPCVETIVLDGTEAVDHARFGYQDVFSKAPLQENSIWRMYSNTKIVTSIAAMILVERGQLGLDDELSTHLPEFADMHVLRDGAETADDTVPAESPILVRQVMSHTAGLSYGFIEPFSTIDQAYMAINPLGIDRTLDDMCQAVGGLPLAYQPGTSWRYSVATDVTARLVEVVSGQSFGEFLAAEIFGPLGMVDTGFSVPESEHDRIITMTAPADMFDPMKPGHGRSDAPPGGDVRLERPFESGGGGLVSTMADYLTFIRMIVNGGEWNGARIVAPETLDAMRVNQCAPGVGVAFPMWQMAGTTFGLGFALKESVSDDEPAGMLGEYHWGGMAGTHTWMSPETGLTGFACTQVMPGFWHPFSHEFKSAVYAAAE